MTRRPRGVGVPRKDGTNGSIGDESTGSDKESGTTDHLARGLVAMVKLKKGRKKGVLISVEFNEYGQPVGKSSMDMAYYIGACARSTFPITINDFRNKELLELKEELWDEIKTIFDLDESKKKMVLSRAGCAHMNFRARLRGLSRDVFGNYTTDPPVIYSNMSSVSLYWKGFVAHAMTDEFKDLSKINKGRAKSMEARYRRACVGYARLREQILEKKRLEGVQNPVVTHMDCWRLARTNAQGDVDDYRTLQILEDSVRISERLEEHELTDIGVNDLFARTMPSQYSGHLRGVGFGVTKKSLTSMVPLSALAQLNKRLDDMDNKLKKMTKGSSPMMHSRGSSHMDKFDRDDDHMDECDNAHSSEYLPEGPVPCYLYLEPPRRYVGKGILHNSPDNHLHGVPLEDGHVRVQFEVGEDSEKDSCLPVCCDDAMKIGTAVGYFLSWPKKWVSLEIECIPLRNSNKDQKKVSMANKDNHHQNTFESTVGVGSSRKELGYPKPNDIPHNNAIFDLLRVMVNNANLYTIQVRMDAYFDEVIWTDHIAKENILEALDDQWQSASNIVFYMRYLGEVYLSTNVELAKKLSFVSPHIFSHLEDSTVASNFLARCLVKYYAKDHLLLVPYNVGKHWLLIAINTETEMIYYMDPSPAGQYSKNKDMRLIVENAMRTFRTSHGRLTSKAEYNRFKWTNIHCPKQPIGDGIHCGHFVGCYVEDILFLERTSIPLNFVRPQQLKSYSANHVDAFRSNWAGYLYNRFVKGKMV